MARTVSTEPKQDTYLRIGGNLIGFPTFSKLKDFVAYDVMSDGNGRYTSFDGYEADDNNLRDMPGKEHKTPEERKQIASTLIDAIALNGLKCDLRINDSLCIRFQSRLCQLAYLAAIVAKPENNPRYKAFNGFVIGEPRIFDYQSMDKKQKMNLFGQLANMG